MIKISIANRYLICIVFSILSLVPSLGVILFLPGNRGDLYIAGFIGFLGVYLNIRSLLVDLKYNRVK